MLVFALFNQNPNNEHMVNLKLNTKKNGKHRAKPHSMVN